jgi:hypothetical protein
MPDETNRHNCGSDSATMDSNMGNDINDLEGGCDVLPDSQLAVGIYMADLLENEGEEKDYCPLPASYDDDKTAVVTVEEKVEEVTEEEVVKQKPAYTHLKPRSFCKTTFSKRNTTAVAEPTTNHTQVTSPRKGVTTNETKLAKLMIGGR